MRAGGKHNDLENVGFTRRHHTFFEMLGNFSFGDYFKRDAIALAWELLTSPEWFAIDPARLYVTVFAGSGGWVGPQRYRGRAAVDRDRRPPRAHLRHGRQGQLLADGRHRPLRPVLGDLLRPRPRRLGVPRRRRPARGQLQGPFPEDEQRYVEIWNLVFMQFDRAADGALTPLPKPSIDTGMGLERIACVLQGFVSNYQTDLFTPLIKRAWQLVVKGGGLHRTLQKIRLTAPVCASLQIMRVPPRSSSRMVFFLRMRAADMSSARSCGERSGMDVCWGRSSLSCMRWCLQLGMKCKQRTPSSRKMQSG